MLSALRWERGRESATADRGIVSSPLSSWTAGHPRVAQNPYIRRAEGHPDHRSRRIARRVQLGRHSYCFSLKQV
jgi:hypothetical protein